MFYKIYNFFKFKNKLKVFKSKVKLEPLEQIKIYCEELLIDSGIPLENVFVHNFNRNGQCTRYNYSSKFEFENFKTSNIIQKNQYYLVLPEIKDYYTASVWIHEIAHYIFKHLDDKRPLFIHEYEAETYSEKMLNKLEIDYSFSHKISLESSKRIHQLELDIVQTHRLYYVHSYVKKSDLNKNILFKELKHEGIIDYFENNKQYLGDELIEYYSKF